MDTYFFVPGDRIHKIEAIKQLEVSHIIIDLEDAVKFSKREAIYKQFDKEKLLITHFIRIPLFDEKNKIDTYYLDGLIALGARKFVFPKLNSIEEFEKVISSVSGENIEVILLIETPRLFLEAKEVLLKYKKYLCGIGIGSHDFMSVIGGEHTLKNLEIVRQQLLYLSRMVQIEAIDIASMELKNESVFKEEIKDGFTKGYDAKFFIHPWQINVFKNINFYTKEDFNWASQIDKELAHVGNSDEFNPIIIDGQVIERPHLNKAKKILKNYKK